MAADLRRIDRSLCMGFFYRGSQMALLRVTPSAMDKHLFQSAALAEQVPNHQVLMMANLPSPAGRITCTSFSTPLAEQALVMGRCPHRGSSGSGNRQPSTIVILQATQLQSFFSTTEFV